ncbi:spermidine synthase [Oceaniglobus roseus]|uniref:spermidine synthase n=1 Tax=Oceaniglobus roseus TaxID=1737570 RepID=UPI000C7F06B6|nr:spermidine synthase [Kandeliimicrobium roseum]
MLPWVLLATAKAPDGDTLRLLRRGDEFSIRVTGGNGLMSSRLSGSEEALATLSIAALRDRAAPHLLIGGLGMGFTLRAAQRGLGPGARLTVAEIVPELAGWASEFMGEVFGDCLEDPRVDLKIADVAALIRKAEGLYDAILLDVDNGPDGLTRPGNDALYHEAGLKAARRALRPGGVLAVWSATAEPAFTARLKRTGFDTEAKSVPAGKSRRGTKHTVWIARAPAKGARA